MDQPSERNGKEHVDGDRSDADQEAVDQGIEDHPVLEHVGVVLDGEAWIAGETRQRAHPDDDRHQQQDEQRDEPGDDAERAFPGIDDTDVPGPRKQPAAAAWRRPRFRRSIVS